MRRKPDIMELDHIRVTLFERDGEPWIKMTFVGTNGEETFVETELDCREFLVRLNVEEKSEEPPPLFGDPSKKKLLS